jgi:transcriptional regulator with XRE-family HTH domain
VSWREFLGKATQGDDQSVIAKRTAVDQSTVSRWVTTGRPGKVENVVKLARAYNVPVLQAFLAAGFLTEEEANVRPSAAPDYSQLTNDELLELVRARMREDVMGNAEQHPAARNQGEADIVDFPALPANPITLRLLREVDWDPQAALPLIGHETDTPDAAIAADEIRAMLNLDPDRLIAARRALKARHEPRGTQEQPPD